MTNSELEAFRRHRAAFEEWRQESAQRWADDEQRVQRLAERQAMAEDWKANYTTIRDVLMGGTDEIEFESGTWDIREAYIRQINYAKALHEVVEQLLSFALFGSGLYVMAERQEEVNGVALEDFVSSAAFDITLAIGRELLTEEDGMIDDELSFAELMAGIDVGVLPEDNATELAITTTIPVIEKARQELASSPPDDP